MANMALEFNLLARDNASRALRDVGNAADRTGHQVDGAAGGFSRMGNAALAAGGALLAGGGLVRGLTSLFEAADESRRITSRTENVIRTTGNAANVSARQVGDLSAAIAAKTGVDDEAIQSGANLLLTFTNIRNEAGDGNDIFDQATQIMTDMSAAMGTDASGSAVQLGKALNDPIKGITALSRVGVSFTEQQKEQIRTLTESGDVLGAQKIILEELQKEFGGAAEAMGTPLDRLRVKAGNLAEDLGGYLLPVVDDAADSFTNLLPSADELGPKLASAAEGALELVPQLVDLAEQGLDLATGVLPLLSGGLSTVLTVAEALGPTLPFVVTGLAGMKIARGIGGDLQAFADNTAKSAGGATALSEGAGKAGKALGALGFALPLIGGAIGLLEDSLNSEAANLERNTQLLEGWQAQLLEGGAAAAGARDNIDRMQQTAARFGADDEFRNALAEATENTNELRDAMTPLELATEDVTYWTNELAAAAADSSYIMRDHNGETVSLTDAQRNLAEATSTQTDRQSQLADITAIATGTTDTYTAGLQEAVDAAKDAQDQTNLLKSALDALTGTNVSVDEATSAYYSSLDQARESLGDLSGEVVANNGLLNLQSEAGREVADRLTGLADNSHGYLAALVAQGAGQEEVTARDAELRDSFFETARQLTGNDDAARLLTERYYGMPDEVVTTIIADTGPAASVIEAFKSDLANGLALTVPQMGLGVPTRAEGGPIYGPGTSTSDSILARLSDGEYVVRASSVDKYGISFLDALNSGRLEKFRDGGLISAFPDPIIQPLGVTQGTADAFAAAVAAALAPKPAAEGGSSTGLIPIMAAAREYAMRTYGVRNVGGFAKRNIIGTNTLSDHGMGKAIDIMTSDLNLGWRIANDFAYGLAHSKFRAENVIWQQSISSNGGPFTGMADRGSPTQNHRDHVHVDTYDTGGILQPGYTLAYNGTGKGETIRTAEQEAALGGPMHVTLQLDRTAVTDLLDGRVVSVISALTDRGGHNPG